jgi:hypothetical protein
MPLPNGLGFISVIGDLLNVYIVSMYGHTMTQYRVSERNVQRLKAWLAKKTNGDRLLRDKKGNSSWDEWTFDQALGELLSEAGF